MYISHSAPTFMYARFTVPCGPHVATNVLIKTPPLFFRALGEKGRDRYHTSCVCKANFCHGLTGTHLQWHVRNVNSSCHRRQRPPFESIGTSGLVWGSKSRCTSLVWLKYRFHVPSCHPSTIYTIYYLLMAYCPACTCTFDKLSLPMLLSLSLQWLLVDT